MAEVQARVGVARLLTLTGVGGCGKTRLALEVARAVRDRFPDGVWLVELGPLADPVLVPHSVAAVVGVREKAGQSTVDALAFRLRTRRLLLVLDNCEHLLDACARLVDGLLRACPDVRVLATSREALGITGEVAWRVPSLSFPDPQHLPPWTEFQHNPAVQLFVERVLAAQPHFVLTERNAPKVAQVCARLDGIPLALELAAARVAALSVDALAARLDQSFRILTGGSRAALPRQQTLRATLDWSYDLLSEPERCLFNRLVVFAGGWSLAAVEAVCAEDGIDRDNVLDLLGQLVSKSLVTAEEAADGAERYRLLETMRQYARERLVAAGEAEAVHRRHAIWFLTFAEALRPHELAWRTLVAGGSVLDQLEREQDNLRAALRYWIESQDEDRAVRQAAALYPIWFYRGSLTEGRTWLEELLSVPTALGTLAARERALDMLGNLSRRHGEYSVALDAFEELLTLQQAAGNKTHAATTLWLLANVQCLQGDYQAAWAYLEASQASGSAVTDPVLTSTWRWVGSNIAFYQGRYDLARTLVTQAMDQPSEFSGSLFSGYCLLRLGVVAREQSDYAEAATLLGRGLLLAHEYRDMTLLAFLFEGFSGLASAVDQHERAIRLGGAAAALREAAGAPLPPAWQPVIERWLAVSRAALTDDAGIVAWKAGQAMGLEQAIAYALTASPDSSATVSLASHAETTPTHVLDTLTPREGEVAGLIAQGLSNRQIAERLVITNRTVAAHIEHILHKLDFASRTQIGVWAAEHGLVVPGLA